MKGLTREFSDQTLQRLFQSIDLGLEAGTIVLIANKRMTDMAHVHADLMCAAGLQPAFHQGGDRWCILRSKTLLHLPMGDGMSTTYPDDRDFLPV